MIKGLWKNHSHEPMVCAIIWVQGSHLHICCSVHSIFYPTQMPKTLYPQAGPLPQDLYCFSCLVCGWIRQFGRSSPFFLKAHWLKSSPQARKSSLILLSVCTHTDKGKRPFPVGKSVISLPPDCL
jgi:hypothetical protein